MASGLLYQGLADTGNTCWSEDSYVITDSFLKENSLEIRRSRKYLLTGDETRKILDRFVGEFLQINFEKTAELIRNNFIFNTYQLDKHRQQHSTTRQYCIVQSRTYSIDNMLIPCHLKIVYDILLMTYFPNWTYLMLLTQSLGY